MYSFYAVLWQIWVCRGGHRTNPLQILRDNCHLLPLSFRTEGTQHTLHSTKALMPFYTHILSIWLNTLSLGEANRIDSSSPIVRKSRGLKRKGQNFTNQPALQHKSCCTLSFYFFIYSSWDGGGRLMSWPMCGSQFHLPQCGSQRVNSGAQP